MKIIQKLINALVYYTTTKPQCYVHIDSPINNQERKQIQYNNRCKRIGVYNGSYLPKDPETLLKKGWVNVTEIVNSSNKKYNRKSNLQRVKFDLEKKSQYAHYHWLAEFGDNGKGKKGVRGQYFDKYGNVCSHKNKKRHIAPLDQMYIRKKSKHENNK